jgi:hypothetical protein
MELIDQNPDLTTFAGLVRSAGYEALLAGDQTYTVFAPENDAFTGVNIEDKDSVLNIVKTHIARYAGNITQTEDKVVMLSAKIIPFQGNEVGGQLVARKNIPAKNGILHTLKSPIPFQRNIWETMRIAGLDSIREYLYAFNINRMIATGPIIDYVDGYPVRDSVALESNEMFYTYTGARGVGYINDEDSVYTMILPTNQAWTDAYRLIEPYYVSDDLSNPDSAQRANTQYAIVKDLVFRGIQDKPETIGPADTLTSTRNTPFTEPGYLFAGARKETVSNGLVYITDQFNYKPWLSWQPPILVEAEYSSGRSTNGTVRALFTRTLSDPEVSGGRFVEVSPTSAGSQPTVFFSLPEVLSAEYNIYCTFLPAQAQYKNDTLGQARVQFEIQQLDRTSLNNPTDKWVWNRVGSVITPPDPLTDTKAIKKMLVAEKFKFPYACVNETRTTVRIAVRSIINRSDNKANFKDQMFIDCITLEPVQPEE